MKAVEDQGAGLIELGHRLTSTFPLLDEYLSSESSKCRITPFLFTL
jgi:hypothetical protein